MAARSGAEEGLAMAEAPAAYYAGQYVAGDGDGAPGSCARLRLPQYAAAASLCGDVMCCGCVLLAAAVVVEDVPPADEDGVWGAAGAFGGMFAAEENGREWVACYDPNMQATCVVARCACGGRGRAFHSCTARGCAGTTITSLLVPRSGRNPQRTRCARRGCTLSPAA